jgi:phosphate transport system substrate-binding protein
MSHHQAAKNRRRGRAQSRAAHLTVLAVVAVLLGGSGRAASGVEPIRVDGSSALYPITAAIAQEYRFIKGEEELAVEVVASDTATGLARFCAGGIDLADASRPILTEEMIACAEAGVDYVELPVAFDAVTLATSATNGFLRCISMADLKRIWEPSAEGKLTRWNQIDPTWPAQPLRLFGPGTGSGTFDHFTAAVMGSRRAQRKDYIPIEDNDALAVEIAAEPTALGYLPLAYAARHADAVRIVAVGDRPPACVSPSELTVRNGRYQPLSRPLLLYVSMKAMERREVGEFVRYYLGRARDVANKVGYVSLPRRAYGLAVQRLDAGRIGTRFGGTLALGLKLRDVLARLRGG